MKNGLLWFSVIFAVGLAIAFAKGVQSLSKPSASVAPARKFGASTTTAAPNTTAATAAPNTTAATAAPNTTAATAAPNTTAATAAPNTTTVHTTTTPPIPKPTPQANLTVGNFTLSDGTGALCVMARMAVQIRMEYNGRSNGEGIFIIQPEKAWTAGECSDPTAEFIIKFLEGELTFQIQKNVSTKSVYVSSVAFNVDYPLSPTGSTKHSAKNESVHLFNAAIGHSYSCKNISVFMGQGYYLDVTHAQIQMFNITNYSFGLPDACPADQTDYRVAIAVGVVLLILIVIVVVAYLIGRRKRMDGYQSL